MTAEQIESFLRGAVGSDFNGCRFIETGVGDLFVVACKDEDGTTRAKIARNSGAFQRDYDWDWEEPRSESGEILDSEIAILEDDPYLECDEAAFYSDWAAWFIDRLADAKGIL